VSALKDITGQRFGRLVALGLRSRGGPGIHSRWLCRCDCGKTHAATSNNLKSGNVKSCGCREGNFKHGQRHTGAYRTWDAMLQRCSNPRNTRYKYYGGRGITVCERWRKFENFFADMGERPSGMSIDRIDNDGNYEPGNCRWITQSQQLKNRTRALILAAAIIISA
jgi:hypothetical protein